MKLIIALTTLIFLFACNSGSDKSADVDTSGIPPIDTATTFSAIDSSSEFLDTFSSNLQPWLEQTIKNPQVRLKDFSYADNWIDDSLVISKQNLDRDFLKTYESVLVYSPDEKKVLDLGSYGSVISKSKNGKSTIQQAEPDIEVAVIDLPAKKRRRIFFSGPRSLVEKGFWMNDSTVVLAGKSHEQNAEIPMLWMIKLNDTSNFITRYEYTLR
ncbi:MAG TPA: hypothetical protein VEV87_09970 [Chitinophagaceae bacterium]|nr:hypothetical protein [Chitinophagaceae bacterium]